MARRGDPGFSLAPWCPPVSRQLVWAPRAYMGAMVQWRDICEGTHERRSPQPRKRARPVNFPQQIDKGKQSETTQQERLKIIGLKAKSYPYSKISEEAGFSISKHGAHRIVKVWEDEQRIKNAGRPEKYPDTDVTQGLMDASEADPKATLATQCLMLP